MSSIKRGGIFKRRDDPPDMEFDFKGQTAVVTGGTRGIGRGITEALLKAGTNVIATYQSNDKLAKEFAESNQEHSRCLDLRSFDVTQYDEVGDNRETDPWVQTLRDYPNCCS